MSYRATYFELPQSSPAWHALSAAIAIHCAVLFVFGTLGVVRAEYRIASGTTTVEVQLVSPPQPETAPMVAPPPEPIVEVKKEEMVIPKKDKKPKPRVDSQPVPVPPTIQPVASINPGPPSPGPNNAKLGVDLQAAYLRNPPPPYPRESRRIGEEGLVLLLVAVNSQGEVSDLSVKASSGFPRLDEAALKAVRKWVFKATRIAGIPTSDTVEVPIRFTLKR